MRSGSAKMPLIGLSARRRAERSVATDDGRSRRLRKPERDDADRAAGEAERNAFGLLSHLLSQLLS
ncbi:hypothetical protein M5W83_17530 [Paenibacillus thiaminolyticus]|uniref:Uncharacterized protein n=1 Tax=Paenibacillus thiaminolyticus TaxID=49283 RepID=A0AAP9J041_PANTH|nr:hypothetical protein [Paenibacillus thiaminolyticus]MCY9536576.1 hypothetical protein [Paenibacillus thiaminolyticus]MCY9601523.1 hypothetical protein [Paenibacillus thiaminolyticus]MCY9608947.1 hypothetical protein [Paenibacillus thiaminolyticus]MCY9612148.1 hypothetical protein [Paenibacillus thiaminolyticus]MCY9619583.1 hypothetical protein [Paenibacillus thiaminolyticus]